MDARRSADLLQGLTVIWRLQISGVPINSALRIKLALNAERRPIDVDVSVTLNCGAPGLAWFGQMDGNLLNILPRDGLVSSVPTAATLQPWNALYTDNDTDYFRDISSPAFCMQNCRLKLTTNDCCEIRHSTLYRADSQRHM